MFVLSWIKFFRGYVYVHLTGYATERFLNLCGSRNILIWNLKPTEDGYYFYISVDGYRSLKPILKKTKTKARILKKYGVPFQLFRYRKHKVFAAGIAVSAVLLFYCSGFVWNIEVKGNSYLSEETILTFLQNENAGFGVPKRNINCEELEEKLREFNVMQTKTEITKVLTARNLDVRFADIIDIGEDAEDAQEKIETLDTLFKAAVKAEVEKRITGSTPKTGTIGLGETITKEEFKKMSLAQQSELYHNNKELYNKLKG